MKASVSHYGITRSFEEPAWVVAVAQPDLSRLRKEYRQRCLSEQQVDPDSNLESSYLHGDFKRGIAEQMGNYMEGGMTMANYWPMRYDTKSADAGFRMLIDHKTNEPRAAYLVLKELSLLGRGAVVKSDCPQPLVYSIATRDANTVAMFVINRSFRTDGIDAAIDIPGASLLDACSLLGDEHESSGVRMTSLAVAPAKDGRFTCLLPPASFSILRFTLRDGGASRPDGSTARTP